MRMSHRHNITAFAGFAGYAVVLATAVTFYALDQMSRVRVEDARKGAAQEAAKGRRYIGTIIIPDEIVGRCRHLEFDNLTGAFREGAAIQCNYEPFALDTGPNRFDAIRDAFSKR
jgi:hypothetical protein